MQTLKAGAAYFTVVFAAGFLLGVIRVLWAVPRVGERVAELMEMPFMLGVSLLAARWVVRRLSLSPASSFGAGLLALALLLAAEFGFVLALRGLSIRDYLATRDPISGIAYAISLLLFSLLPLFVARLRQR